MLLTTLSVSLLGCGEGGPLSGDGDPAGPSGPTIKLTSPVADEQRYGNTLDALFDVRNFTLDEAGIGADDVAGRGHVHAYLDGVQVGETADTTFAFSSLPSGPHTLEVRLADNDHDENWEGSWVYMETRDSRISILSPPDGNVYAASSAPLTLQLTDFTVSPDAAFGDVAFGQGRYQVRIDGEVVDFGFDPAAFEVSQLPEGIHEVGVELVTSDGAPLDPPSQDTVSIEVLPLSPFLAIDRSPYLGEHGSATVPLSIAAANTPLSYHLYVDGDYAVGGEAPELTLGHVAGGYHFLELVATDGSSELPIRDHLHLFVAPERPDIAITYPGDLWGVPAAFSLTVQPESFTLDPAGMGGANVPGHGHWAVLVDGVSVAESATTSAALSGLLPGDRLIRVALENNDHTPVEPPVYTEIRVTVE
ncbi:MAG: hypothetical protein Q8P18_30645 [Pseudomonadota bacterium]|nr:hypothetical protein [Pseudomonadota bacterium]